MRKKTLKPNSTCRVKGKNEIVRVGLFLFCFFVFLLQLHVLSKTNHFTVNAKSKCKRHDVKVYGFACYMIMSNCAGCVGSWFTGDALVLGCVGTWVAWIKMLRESSGSCGLIKFQRWSITFWSDYKSWGGSRILR